MDSAKFRNRNRSVAVDHHTHLPVHLSGELQHDLDRPAPARNPVPPGHSVPVQRLLACAETTKRHRSPASLPSWPEPSAERARWLRRKGGCIWLACNCCCSTAAAPAAELQSRRLRARLRVGLAVQIRYRDIRRRGKCHLGRGIAAESAGRESARAARAQQAFLPQRIRRAKNQTETDAASIETDSRLTSSSS